MQHAYQTHITADEYLNGEHSSDLRHEFIDGIVYAMSGGGKSYNFIALNSRPLSVEKGYTSGFTLIELITVIVILGVLAVFAAPRIINTGDFNARGFHDETMGLLRYAQKTAIAQRRVVCVELNPTGVTLTMDTNTPPDGTCDAAPAVPLPSTPRGGSGLAATIELVAGVKTALTAFNFTPFGATNQSVKITITIANSTNIEVEAETGYVHE